jgi:hypothetical protein
MHEQTNRSLREIGVAFLKVKDPTLITAADDPANASRSNRGRFGEARPVNWRTGRAAPRPEPSLFSVVRPRSHDFGD